MRTVWWGGSVDESERFEIVEMMNEVLTSYSKQCLGPLVKLM